MDLKNKVWKYATALVVVLILLNPEMTQLAVFIDAVGLELFLMLIEIQVMAIIGVLLNNKIKPAFYLAKNFIGNHQFVTLWKNIKEEPGRLIYVAPSQATLMHALVLSAAIGVVFNVQT